MGERVRRAGWWLTTGWLLCPGCWTTRRHSGHNRRLAWRAARHCPVGYCYWGSPRPAFGVRDAVARATRPRRTGGEQP